MTWHGPGVVGPEVRDLARLATKCLGLAQFGCEVQRACAVGAKVPRL